MTALRPELPVLMLEEQVKAALLEDLGRAGDITTLSTIGPDRKASAEMSVREAGVVAGLDLARTAFRLIDPSIRFEAVAADGDRVASGATIARISGRARGDSVRRAGGTQLSHASFGSRDLHGLFRR